MDRRFCFAAMTASSAVAEDNSACSSFAVNVYQDALKVSFFLILSAAVNIKDVIPVLLIRLRSLLSITE